MTPASNVEEELSRVFFFFFFFSRVGAQQPPLSNPRVNYGSSGSRGKKERLRSSSWKVKLAKESPHSISLVDCTKAAAVHAGKKGKTLDNSSSTLQTGVISSVMAL